MKVGIIIFTTKSKYHIHVTLIDAISHLDIVAIARIIKKMTSRDIIIIYELYK